MEEGIKLEPSTFELFLKNDEKGDPFINESHVVAFGWGTAEQLVEMKKLSLKVNEVLTKLFDDAGLLLVDFKLEFGVFHGQIVLGDEFSPDGLPPVGQRNPQEDGQGPLPPGPGRRDRSLRRSCQAPGRAAVSGAFTQAPDTTRLF